MEGLRHRCLNSGMLLSLVLDEQLDTRALIHIFRNLQDFLTL